MNELAETTKRPTTREAIDKLRGILTEALVIEADIVGEEPREKVPESGEYVLDFIESELSLAIRDADYIVRQLRQIQNRL